MSDDTPTERFEAPSAAATVGEGGKKKSKLLILILSIVGGLLLIAVVVLLTLLLSRGIGGPSAEPVSDVSTSPSASSSETPSESPSASPSETPSESPSASPSSAPPPPPPPPPPTTTGPVFTSFSPTNNKSVGCANETDAVPVTFTWTSTGASEAAIGVATTDAFAGAYATGLPPSGSYELNYQCSNASQIYTVSIRGTSGQTNKTITLKR